MSKSFALAAFNTAVVITNGAHTVKRCAVHAAEVTAAQSKATATASKEAGIAFWAGMKYAHQYNKANAVAAEDAATISTPVIYTLRSPSRCTSRPAGVAQASRNAAKAATTAPAEL